MTKKEYKELINALKIYSDAYYQNNQSLVSNFEFDMMMHQCRLIEKQHPEWVAPDAITQTVGSDVTIGNGNNPHLRNRSLPYH